MKPIHLCFLLLGVPIVTGCPLAPFREKQAKFCDQLATFKTEVAALDARLTTQPAVTDLQQAEVHLRSAFRSVQVASQEVSEVSLKDLEDSYGELDQTLKALPPESSIQQAIALTSSKLTRVHGAIERVWTEARCR